MIVRNCQFCFVEIDGPSAYQNRDGSILCKECFDAGHTVPKREMCCDCGVAEVDPPPRCGMCWTKDFQDRYEKRNENKKQPDNSHYTKGGIEPWTYIQANNLNFFEGSVVKYVTRWRHKNGIEDLRKARVYIDELIRQEKSK